MMSMERNNTKNKLHSAIRKSIAEEYGASQLYTLWLLASENTAKPTLADMFTKFSDEKFKRNMLELVEWCNSVECDVPCTEPEMKRTQSDTMKKFFNHMKKGKDAGYYIDQAISMQNYQVLQYRKILEIDEVSQFTDLQSLLWNIYYDEEQRLRDLHTAKIAFEANANMII